MSASSQRHLPEEVLQAYVAGEVDPAKRAAYEAHLGGCSRCRERLDRVRGMYRLFQAVHPRGPDDLSWRRIRDRVRIQLEDDAGRGASTLDLIMGRRWVTAGLVAVASVAVLVWFAPRPSPEAPLPRVAAAPETVDAVITHDAPVAVSLRSGVEIELGTYANLTLEPRPGRSARLVLRAGRLGVTDMRPAADLEPVEVHATPFRLRSARASYAVARVARGVQVRVSTGEVTVTGPGLDEPAKVGPGDTTTLVDPASETAAAPPAPAPRLPPKRVAQAPADAGTAPVLPPAAVPETSVEMELPDDPVARAWHEARAAYFQRRDLEEAVRWAKEVERLAGTRPEAGWAADLLCEAYTAGRHAEEAVQACGRLLDGVSGEEARRVHKRLAELHRTQRGDCATAIAHYNQVLVFGRSTPLDEDARVHRAECAMDTGDFDLAERDLTQLEASRTFERPELLARLKKRLSEMRITQERRGVSD